MFEFRQIFAVLSDDGDANYRLQAYKAREAITFHCLMRKAAAQLKTYRAKRDFTKTQEPSGARKVLPTEHRRFVIQKHAASHLHWDLRLELNGVFKSWAVTKGPSIDPADKRLAVEVEDHPLEYAKFEGQIPPGQYGAGKVVIWDHGIWLPESEPHEQYRKGHLTFTLEGERLSGRWHLIRRGKEQGEKSSWLLFKGRDEPAQVKGTKAPASTPPSGALRARSIGQRSSPMPRLAYLVSHYPALSHTFILREVRRLRAEGFEVEVASINAPDRPLARLTAEEREEAERTFYVKRAGPLGAVGAQLATLATRPGGWLRGLAFALRLGGTDLKRLLYSLFYFVEAASPPRAR